MLQDDNVHTPADKSLSPPQSSFAVPMVHPSWTARSSKASWIYIYIRLTGLWIGLKRCSEYSIFEKDEQF